MPQLRDLTGQTFGRLTVVGRAEDSISAGGRHRVMWVCECKCGNNITVYGDNLAKGATQSCGCLRAELLSIKRTTHGQSKTRLYSIWRAMRNRCYRETDRYYDRYGGRGIYVCDEWNNDYASFADWAINAGYQDGYTIDRIDNDGAYTPTNCRWVNRTVQANNRSSNRILTVDGESHNVTEWANILEVSPKTLFSRVYAGMSDEDVVRY